MKPENQSVAAAAKDLESHLHWKIVQGKPGSGI